MKNIWANFKTLNYNIGYFEERLHFYVLSNQKRFKGKNMEIWAFLQ